MSLNVDKMIHQLLEVKGTNKKVKLDEREMQLLCFKVRDILMVQPNLLELETPIVIAGDIHGQYHDLLKIFDAAGYPPNVNYLFLGDYVDRGKNSLETICLLFAYKVKYPENFFLLRGNHECGSICKIYGFYDECKRRYGTKLFKTFTDVFDFLPFAAIVDDKVFCCHGGLSRELEHLSLINQIRRPIADPLQGLACDLLWSDPCASTRGWAPNDRGVSYTFGIDVLEKFLKKHDLDLMCRGHQVVEDGYEFFGNRKLITIFSAPNYCGEFDNAAALLTIDENLCCSFKILTPKSSGKGSKVTY